MTPLRHPTPCPACGRILSLNGDPCRCHGCGEPIAPQFAAEALLINQGFVRAPIMGRFMGQWAIPGTDAMVSVGERVVRIYANLADAPTVLPLGNLDAIQVAIAALAPAPGSEVAK